MKLITAERSPVVAETKVGAEATVLGITMIGDVAVPDPALFTARSRKV